MNDFLEQLVDAFLDGDSSLQFYYNITTKDVFVPMDGTPYDDEDEDAIVPVPYKSSKEMYEVMVDFSKLQDDSLKEKLFKVLNNKKPFVNFKEVVSDADLTDAWREYEENYAKQQILEWLETL